MFLFVNYSSIVGKFDAMLDRGALVAVNVCDRKKYVNLMRDLEADKCNTLLLGVEYDMSKHPGE